MLDFCKSAEEEKEKLTENVEFLEASVMRSTEETLTMEKKLNEAQEQSHKMVKVKSDKLSEATNTLQSVISKTTQESTLSYPSLFTNLSILLKT